MYLPSPFFDHPDYYECGYITIEGAKEHSCISNDLELMKWLGEPWAKYTEFERHEDNPIVRLMFEGPEGLAAVLQEKLMRIQVLSDLMKSGLSKIEHQLMSGGSPDQIRHVMKVVEALAVKTGREEERCVNYYFTESCIMSANAKINIDGGLNGISF